MGSIVLDSYLTTKLFTLNTYNTEKYHMFFFKKMYYAWNYTGHAKF